MRWVVLIWACTEVEVDSGGGEGSGGDETCDARCTGATQRIEARFKACELPYSPWECSPTSVGALECVAACIEEAGCSTLDAQQGFAGPFYTHLSCTRACPPSH